MKPLIIANWKAAKTIKESVEWVKEVKSDLEEVDYAEIIICPPFTSLPFAASLFKDTNVKVGAQDVSKFEKGAYTGEVTAEMLEGLVDYCIVGHSERRKYFGEEDDDIVQKVKNLLKYSITPILCVSNLSQLDSYLERGRLIIDEAQKIVFVYEPPSAISGGGIYHPESPKEASENAGKIALKIGKKVTTIYGGSVNPENVGSFFAEENIEGALIGQASLAAETFLDLLKAAKLGSVIK
ncbi:MAG: triose-phosphate isomerase [Candidatus Woykebacteria bacterium]